MILGPMRIQAYPQCSTNDTIFWDSANGNCDSSADYFLPVRILHLISATNLIANGCPCDNDLSNLQVDCAGKASSDIIFQKKEDSISLFSMPMGVN